MHLSDEKPRDISVRMQAKKCSNLSEFQFMNRTRPIIPGGCAEVKPWICQSTCTIEVTSTPSSMQPAGKLKQL